jgi:TRAP-type C4-dicarboxylate transport system substrate-binding protein
MRSIWLRHILVCCLASAIWGPTAQAEGQPNATVELKIVGGLGGVRQFTSFERPFWESEIAEISRGRIVAHIHPFDRSGIRGQDMLQLLKIGVVPFGNAPIALAASDTPALEAIDLPGFNPDFASLRKRIEAFRPTLTRVLRDVYNVELLGIYSYPAQVLFCARPFEGLQTISGFKIRTANFAQSELMSARGALPMMTPFSETVAAVKRKAVDCALTGILSGHEIGLGEVTTHVYAHAITWSVSIFGANRSAWANLPPDVRETLVAAVRVLEGRILNAADEDTRRGFDCSRGLATCGPAPQRPHVIVSEKGFEGQQLRMIRETVIPQWLERCGDACAPLIAEGLVPAIEPRGAADLMSASDTGGRGD